MDRRNMGAAKLKPVPRHKLLCLGIALALAFFVCRLADAATQSLIVVDKNKRISGILQEISVAEALKRISEKLPLQITGSPPADQVGVRFQRSTLQEAVRKLMRGYNYVLLDQGPSGGAVLTIVGKAERNPGTETRADSVPAAPAAAPQQPPEDKDRIEGAGAAPASTEPPANSPESMDTQSERSPGPPNVIPGPPPGETRLERNESSDSAARYNDSINNESTPVDGAAASTMGQSGTNSSSLGLLRKNTLDSYFNIKRS